MDKDRYNFSIENYDNKFLVGITDLVIGKRSVLLAAKTLQNIFVKCANINGHFQLMRKYFKMFDQDDPVLDIELAQSFRRH